MGSEIEARRIDNPVRILPQPSILTNAPLQLKYTDLRFLHHFLTIAYPHLPAGNDSIWIHEIPQNAETRPYLMHALLGLGGSHLAMTMTTPAEVLAQPASSATPPSVPLPRTNSAITSNYNTPENSSTSTIHSTTSSDTQTPQAISNRALKHRSIALSGLNHAITADDWSQSSVDAMLATVYALTFQATYLPHDGMVDFMTMVRGCALITARIGDNNAKSSFALDPMAHIRVLEGEFVVRELLGRDVEGLIGDFGEKGWIEKGVLALKRMKGLLIADTYSRHTSIEGADGPLALQQQYYDAVCKALQALKISTREAYIAYTSIYAVWWQCSNTDFEPLADLGTSGTDHEQRSYREGDGNTGNSISQILALWFLAFEVILAPIFAAMHGGRKGGEEALDRRCLISIGWMKGLEGRLLQQSQGRADLVNVDELVSWPMKIARLAETKALGRLKTGIR